MKQRASAWEELSNIEYDEVWDRFEGAFNFNPRYPPMKVRGISEPIPSKTYDVSFAYEQSPEHFEELQRDLHDQALKAFCRVVEENVFLYSLDWQHDSYRFWPQLFENQANLDQWKIPVFPDGDYFIFLSQDFQNGTFGHPWEQTICVFGEKLLDAFACNEPQLFHNLLRVNGCEIVL